MSPRARLAAALTLSLVCVMSVAAWPGADMHGSVVPSLTSADLDASGPADWAEESDQEDSDSVHWAKSLGAPATVDTVHPLSAERTRRLRLDRPPEVDPRS